MNDKNEIVKIVGENIFFKKFIGMIINSLTSNLI